MAAEGIAVAGGGTVGGRLAKDSVRQPKGPEAVPNQRRGSAQSRDTERRAHQWCREYLGGAWRRVRPEELRVDPVRWEVRGQPLPVAGRGGGGGRQGLRGCPAVLQPLRAGRGRTGRAGSWRRLRPRCGPQRGPQQLALPLLAAGPPAQRRRGAAGGAAAAVRGHPAGEAGARAAQGAWQVALPHRGPRLRGWNLPVMG